MVPARLRQALRCLAERTRVKEVAQLPEPQQTRAQQKKVPGQGRKTVPASANRCVRMRGGNSLRAAARQGT